uniref:Uncharacterized protein n=1 Tax=mine drainage metagenome TaxID=410659 RepID=E6PJD4_9ZZZZ
MRCEGVPGIQGALLVEPQMAAGDTGDTNVGFTPTYALRWGWARFARLITTLFLLVAVPLPLWAAPDPYAIFARAQTHWMREVYPPYIKFTVAITVKEGGTWKTERYKSAYNTVDGAFNIDPVSDYQDTHPASGHGVLLYLFFFPIGKPTPPINFLGVPKLSPTYTFGMAPFHPMAYPYKHSSSDIVAAIRKEFHDLNPRISSPSASARKHLQVIATVSTVLRDYRISLVGVERISGHQCYHLSLQPLRNPGTFRLRDLWIDRETYATVQLRIASNFIHGPGSNVPWTVRFSRIAGIRYIKWERASVGISYRGLIYTVVYIRFEKIHTKLKAVHKNRFPMFVPLFLQEPPALGGVARKSGPER